MNSFAMAASPTVAAMLTFSYYLWRGHDLTPDKAYAYLEGDIELLEFIIFVYL